jgi:LacI family transcriptional regulator
MTGRKRSEASPRLAESRVGIREVAEHLGVATSSVSRALSGHPDVSDSMRARVLAAVGELGYAPDPMAQGLRRGLTRTVGFLVSDISNPLFSEIAVGAELALRDAGRAMVIANSLGTPEQDLAQLRVLAQRRVDALIVSLSEERDAESSAHLASLDRPAVLLDREVEGLSLAAVLSDHRQGMREAAEHLLALGHRRIGFIGGNPGIRPTRERAHALEEACAGVRGAQARLEYGSYSAGHGERAAELLLTREGPPTALVAGGNQILIGVLRALRRRGVSIPRDLSLVTCDDVALSEFLTPALATVSRDTREMGRVAAELVLAAIDGGSPATRVLPVTFRARDSCGPPA